MTADAALSQRIEDRAVSERIEQLGHDIQVYFAANRHDADAKALQADFFAARRVVCGAEPSDYRLLAFLMVWHSKIFGGGVR